MQASAIPSHATTACKIVIERLMKLTYHLCLGLSVLDDMKGDPTLALFACLFNVFHNGFPHIQH